MYSVNPSARIVDISHDVQPQNIRQASYLLWSSYKYFPAGTIFVCVVDPGVGSKRRIFAIRTPQYIFLAPDNGVLDMVLADEHTVEAVEIMSAGKVTDRAKSFVLPKISSTFHGRDIFAPIAGRLSLGVGMKELGSPIEVRKPPSIFVNAETHPRKARVVHIDRFGNIITNIRAQDFSQIKMLIPGLLIGKKRIRTWTNNYEEAPANKPCLIVGSSDLVEIVVKNGNAAKVLPVNLDTPIGVVRR